MTLGIHLECGDMECLTTMRVLSVLMLQVVSCFAGCLVTWKIVGNTLRTVKQQLDSSQGKVTALRRQLADRDLDLNCKQSVLDDLVPANVSQQLEIKARRYSTTDMGSPKLIAREPSQTWKQQRPPRFSLPSPVDISKHSNRCSLSSDLCESSSLSSLSEFPHGREEGSNRRWTQDGFEMHRDPNAGDLSPRTTSIDNDFWKLLNEPSMEDDEMDTENESLSVSVTEKQGMLLNIELEPLVAYSHKCITVLFSDIVGFTTLSTQLQPQEVMTLLHSLFYKFDTTCEKAGIFKVETIGDGYMAAAGLFETQESTEKSRSTEEIKNASVSDMLQSAKVFHMAAEFIHVPGCDEGLSIRVGLHSGPLFSGIVGKTRSRYCLFGETVNYASRMETTCPPGHINLSQVTYDMLSDEEKKSFKPQKTFAKGLGHVMTYNCKGPCVKKLKESKGNNSNCVSWMALNHMFVEKDEKDMFASGPPRRSTSMHKERRSSDIARWHEESSGSRSDLFPHSQQRRASLSTVLRRSSLNELNDDVPWLVTRCSSSDVPISDSEDRDFVPEDLPKMHRRKPRKYSMS